MSPSWHLRCVDCGDTLRFDGGGNGRLETMRLLIRHAHRIVEASQVLRPLLDEDRWGWILFCVETPWGAVDIDWLNEHADHRLTPVDGYGTQSKEES